MSQFRIRRQAGNQTLRLPALSTDEAPSPVTWMLVGTWVLSTVAALWLLDPLRFWSFLCRTATSP